MSDQAARAALTDALDSANKDVRAARDAAAKAKAAVTEFDAEYPAVLEEIKAEQNAARIAEQAARRPASAEEPSE